MVRHNGIISLYGDNYALVDSFCFHRFHEDGLEIRNLNAVHYTKLRSVENMREAYRAVERQSSISISSSRTLSPIGWMNCPTSSQRRMPWWRSRRR
ncbi:MAG: hypothetical protein R2856_16710 [Caldilineaceae bacterium]